MIGTRPTVAFIHLPRTGGTSMIKMIVDQIGKNRCLIVKSPLNPIAMEDVLGKDLLVIMGHMPYGVHTLTPVRYVTMMRDPVKRLVSSFRHAMSRERLPGQEWTMSFQQYAHKLQNWNTQCQFLAGVHKLPKADRGRHLLETAKEHMATFELVSFIDHIQEFAHALGLKGEVPRTNRREEALFEPTAEDLARARAVNELDQELYDWARARYLPAKADALKA